jgi:hypothetical protein
MDPYDTDAVMMVAGNTVQKFKRDDQRTWTPCDHERAAVDTLRQMDGHLPIVGDDGTSMIVRRRALQCFPGEAVDQSKVAGRPIPHFLNVVTSVPREVVVGYGGNRVAVSPSATIPLGTHRLFYSDSLDDDTVVRQRKLPPGAVGLFQHGAWYSILGDECGPDDDGYVLGNDTNMRPLSVAELRALGVDVGDVLIVARTAAEKGALETDRRAMIDWAERRARLWDDGGAFDGR